MHCNIYKPVFHHGDACTCNVSFYNVQSMELHSYTCIYQKFCILSFIPFYQCILLYMAAHTRSFTIFWSRGWPHNAVRISTFCASSASAFYHTVWITPEARCKQSDRILWLMWMRGIKSLMAVTDVVCICCAIHGLNLHTAVINWHCDDLSRPLKENREVGSTRRRQQNTRTGVDRGHAPGKATIIWLCLQMNDFIWIDLFGKINVMFI